GTDQSYHLFDLLFHRRSYISKEQVRFVKKENQLWFFRIADFRKILEQLRQHPQQKRRINLRRLLHQFVCRKNVDDAASILRLDQIFKVKRRLTEKLVCSLRFQCEQVALDRACAGSRNASILRFKLVGVVGDVLQHRAQILQIEKEQSVFVGDFEHHVEDAFLRVIQFD